MTARVAGTRLASSIAGVAAPPVVSEIDARWLMAYAAGLGDRDPRYYDTTSPGGPLAHPLFPVCYEWPAALALRERTIARALGPLGVHATHHLVAHRPPRAGDRLATTASVVALEPRRAGALVVVRFVTVDADGRPVTTTDYGTVYRGVACEASVRVAEPLVAAPAANGGEARWAEGVDVPPEAPHVYTECARIWNPIHTDVAVARAAGLPGPILHGTATLALAVSRVLARDALDPGRVREVRARFTGMVPLPARLVVAARARGGHRVAFDVTTDDGRPVLSQGVIES